MIYRIPHHLRSVWFVVAVAMACQIAAGEESAFDAGLAQAQAGDYAAAREAFSEIASHGAEYNLGVLARELGNEGQSRLHFARAWLIDPSHAETRAQLPFLEPLAVSPRAIRQSWSWLPWDTWVALASLSFWALAGLFLAHYLGWFRWRPVWWAALPIAFVFVVSAWAWLEYEAVRHWHIVTSDARLRPAPVETEAGAEGLPVLLAGELVTAQLGHEEFIRVSTRSGETAWLPASVLAPIWPNRQVEH